MQPNPWNSYEAPFLFRVYPPKNNMHSSIYILIHGWTGNEYSMSVFHQAATGNAYCFAPRGIIEIESESYGWVDIRTNPIPTYSDFSKISNQLFHSVKALKQNYDLKMDQKMNLIGFSQGAAVALSLAIEFPEYINKVALLSGFLLPDPPLHPSESIKNVKIYIAHGTEDKIVDFSQAEKMFDYFSGLGAQTKLCSEEIGHKIGAKCVLNLKKFFQELTSLEK